MLRTIEQMLRHFRYVLESVIRDPSHRISEVELQSEGEQRELLERWNQTQAEYPREASLVELLDAQAARTPHQVAAVFEGQQTDVRRSEPAGQPAGPSAAYAGCRSRHPGRCVVWNGRWRC